MKNRSTRTRLLVFMIVAIGCTALVQVLERSCPEGPEYLNITSVINIHNLYPWPNAKIPFACHTLKFLKSPFAPRLLGVNEAVFKEDGVRILSGVHRDGVVGADLSISGDLLPLFIEPMKPGKMPMFAKNISLYVDDNELEIGHVSYREIDLEFKFATIFNPFLLPGRHVGKIVLLMPSGETREYQWPFEITWW